MAINLQLNDRLIQEAVALGGHRCKRAAVTQALTDYIRHLRQEQIFACNIPFRLALPQIPCSSVPMPLT